jgi:hypothetical protein
VAEQISIERRFFAYRPGATGCHEVDLKRPGFVELDPRRQLAHRAIAGYLAGYSGATLDAYRLDLRQWATWLDGNGVDILSVQRAHIELYARWSEEHGPARSTISRRLSTICGFYRYCSQETVIDRDPAAYVRRPKIDYESHTLGLDRNELGAFLVQAGLCGGRGHALMCLLCVERAAHLRSPRRRDREHRLPARTSHPVRAPQRTQDRHDPARSAHGDIARPVHRRTHERADLPQRRRHSPSRPARRGEDRAPIGEGSRDRQADQSGVPVFVGHCYANGSEPNSTSVTVVSDYPEYAARLLLGKDATR